MDSMDSAEAREHIEMVEHILAQSRQRLCAGGEYFVVWGLYGGIACAIWQLVNNHVTGYSLLWVQVLAFAAAMAFSILRGRATGANVTRISLLQRDFFNVLWLTLGLSFIINVAAYNIFSGWAQAAIWSFSEAIVLFFIGMHGNRPALLGGIAVVVSILVANFVGPSVAGYVLGAGIVVGYAGFGTVELITRD